jgi:hypothetical protein
LAHKTKSLNLFLEDQKEKTIKTKMVLEPKIIQLPYRKINLDLKNLAPLHPPHRVRTDTGEVESKDPERVEEAEETTNVSESLDKVEYTEMLSPQQ